MPNLTIIDGYNLIWSTEKFDGGTLQSQRERLLAFLETARLAGSARNQTVVVFDGKEDVDSPPWKGSVRVTFSRGTDADVVIKQMVDALPNARNTVVVTNDRDIRSWVRSAHAKVISCEEFLQQSARSKKPFARPEKPAPEETVYLNKELRRLWKID